MSRIEEDVRCIRDRLSSTRASSTLKIACDHIEVAHQLHVSVSP